MGGGLKFQEKYRKSNWRRHYIKGNPPLKNFGIYFFGFINLGIESLKPDFFLFPGNVEIFRRNGDDIKSEIR